MAKKAIAFGVVRRVYGTRYSVMEITSETGDGRKHGRVYGRDEFGMPTNRAARDVYGRFDTKEKAQAACEAVARVIAAHNPKIKAAEQAVEQARAASKAEVAATLGAYERGVLPLRELKEKYGATILIGRQRYARFTPYPNDVDDETCRCIGCGQIDEPEYHDTAAHNDATGERRLTEEEMQA